MTTHDDLERGLTGWLHDAATPRDVDLHDVFAQSRTMRQQPAWASPWRWLSMQLQMTRVHVPRFVPILALVGLLIVAIVAAALIAGAPRPLPAPFGLAENGRIAYVSDGQIWTAEPDGSDARRVSVGDQDKGFPLWSRDGTRLAFLEDRLADGLTFPSLVLANADGSDQVTIVEAARALRHVTWAPDGSTIAFSRWIEYNGQRDRIFVAPADGSTPPVQIGDPDLSAFYPTFSPNGRRIAFVSDHYPALCHMNDCFGEFSFGLHVMASDGSGVRTLASGAIQPRVSETLDRIARPFDWAPDGETILFSGVSVDDGSFGVYRIDPDGGAPERIDDGDGAASAASFDPSGERIAYLRTTPSDTGPWDVIVAAADGSSPVTVATDVARYAPQWSPDGTSLAVVENVSGGQASIRIIPLDGGESRVIPVTKPRAESSIGSGLDMIAWQRLGFD
jgi:Tol biopolymer transport system component